MKRALIVKLGAIGDVMMALPAVHALHTRGYSIDWVASSQAASLLRLHPFVRVLQVDEEAILRGSLLERLRELRRVWATLATYDLAATLYYDRRYRLISLPTRAKRRIRLRGDDRATQLLPGRHHTDEFARILLSDDGAEADMGPVPHSLPPLRPPVLPPSPLPPAVGCRVVLAPGGARNLLRDDQLRRWQLDHYAALAKLLTGAGHEVVLAGGPGDTWVREAFVDIPHTDLIGQLSLPDLMALFDASDAVVTHDSGPLHLAGATACALVGIFGPVDPRSRLPRRPGAIALWGGKQFACRPCYDGMRYADCRDNACMAQVTPAMVFATVSKLLADRQTGPQPMAPADSESLFHIIGIILEV